MPVFYTIKSPHKKETVIKKSVFISSISPARTEDEARDFINQVKERFSDANHNVFAYLIGNLGQVQRFSDDGEPSGTAGVPVLEVLKKGGLTNVAVVVTRYFGGILLGTGGLVRAYTDAVKSVIEEAGIVQYSPHCYLEINAPYNCHEFIKSVIDRFQGHITGIEYTDRVLIGSYVPEPMTEQFFEEVSRLDHVLVKKGETKYLPNEK